jgi:hypothetical protein
MLNLSGKDLRALSKPVLLLLVAIVIGAACVSYTRSAVKQAQADVTAQETRLAEARGRVQQSDEEKSVIERYVNPYMQLEQAGIVGDEQRISWIDALRTANSEADLYGVQYELGAQQAYSFASEVNAGTLPVNQSMMKLRFGLLHEGDLFRFFQALAAQKVGRFAVTRCSLQRLPVNLAVPVNQPTLEAECDVAWITIPHPAAEETKR